LVPGVDRSLRQIDKSSSDYVRQCHGQIVGLYLIVSSYSLDDCMIDLDEFFEIVGSIIFVDVPSLEFLWPPDLPERSSQSMETAPP
jgi:hypothetical protein